MNIIVMKDVIISEKVREEKMLSKNITNTTVLIEMA